MASESEDEGYVYEQTHPVRKLLLGALLVVALLGARKSKTMFFPLDPLYPKPYIVLYGRDSCGYCAAMRRELDSRKIPYKYKQVDDPAVQENELYPRMEQAWLSTASFDLPVMDVNGRMRSRPSFATVYDDYARGGATPAPARQVGQADAPAPPPVEQPKPALDFRWPPVVGEKYPDLALLDANGREVRLSSFKGRVIVLEPIGMTCAACNAFSGANRPEIGHFENASPQPDLPSAAELFDRYAGVPLDDDRLVYVQLLLYNMQMQQPSVDDAKRWAEHFKSSAANRYVLVPKVDLRGAASSAMVPGFQLIDRDFVLRHDGTGDNPKENLWTAVFPAVKDLL